MHPSLRVPALTLAAAASAADAQTPPAQLDPVVMSVERARQSSFDAPAAISAVGREVIEQGGPQVNLSEALNRVPGISILNRQNYAQDLQLSIRGFGSRSTFGIRGVRLIVDGIPATMPDGQGQASNIALGSAARIEVLRGPMAQLYGNAAGGVVQVFTDVGPGDPTTTLALAGGPYGQIKPGLRFTAGNTSDAVGLDLSQYQTDGYRDHSAAERSIFNGKWQHDAGSDTRLSVVVNALDQPEALDPLGLTRDQWQADPTQAAPAAVQQNARKSVAQQQIGAVLEHALAPATSLNARVYFGKRDLDNALSTLPPFQVSNTSSGGIVEFSRDYMGLGLQLSHAVPLDQGRALRLTGGVELDRMNEDRQGYVNDGGVRGDLKRNESNRVENRDVYAQAALDLSAAWTATLGVRSSRVEFRSEDFFVKPGNPAIPGDPDNPDDSGSADYSATNPVVGLSFLATPTLNLYANAGRGFETPTFTEIAYRPPCPVPPVPGTTCVETGLNTDLKASRSRHFEVGAKWKLAETQRLDAALYDIRTEDEIVVNSNVGGRSTFRNAGKTSRQGLELSYLGRFAEAWRATLSVTALRARFDDAFVSGSGPTAVTVPAGNHLPATPERSAFAELVWAPAGAWGGFNAGAEVVHTGKLYVNDLNEDAAPAATVLNLRAALAQSVGGWTFTQLLRVDNATDRSYAGSVIVNESAKRFFEPALPRNWLLAATASYAFR